MPELAPFRGLMFNPDKVTLSTALASVTALADGPARARLHDAPANAVRVIAAGSEGDRAAATRLLDEWRASETVVRDPSRAIYRVVETAPAPPGLRPPVRRGVIAAVRLESVGDARVGVPERVVPARVADRVATLKATALQVEPVLAIYVDAVGEVERLLRSAEARPVAVDVTTADGVRHQLWRIADAELIGKLRRALMAKKLLVAEGHHAYAAMVGYRDHLAAKVGGTGLAQYSSAQYGLMQLCASSDEGLQVQPIHRLVQGVADFDRKTFLTRAAEFFTVERIAGGGKDTALIQAALASTHAHLPAVALALPGEADVWLLTLDPHVDPRNHGVAGHPAVARLDVNLLHGLIFDHILGLDTAAQDRGAHLRYLGDPAAALAALGGPGVQAAFLLGPTRLETIRHVVDVGEMLPPWSTHSYPQLTAGLVMAAIDPDDDLM